MISAPRCIAPTGDICGEGAVWHAAHNAVYWTDINRFLIHRFQLDDSSVRTWFFDEPVTALALTTKPDLLVVVLGSSVILWEPTFDIRHAPIFRLEGWPAVRLNDARCDPRGSLWLGSMRNNVNPDGSSVEVGGQDGVLLRLDPDGSVVVWKKGIGISNTLAWSPDRRTFYSGDSIANVIWAFDCDFTNGAISNERPFFHGIQPRRSRWLSDGLPGLSVELPVLRPLHRARRAGRPNRSSSGDAGFQYHHLHVWGPRPLHIVCHKRRSGAPAQAAPRGQSFCHRNRCTRFA